MPVTIPIVEKALIFTLENPATVITAIHPDTVRAQAAEDLRDRSYTVHMGYRPQNDVSDLAVTLERAGGEYPTNSDSFAGKAEPLFDLTVWHKGNDKTLVQPAIELGELIRTVLVGLRGTIQGVVICNIGLDGEPLETNAAPSDASSDWVSRYTYLYMVRHERLNADQRIAERST